MVIDDGISNVTDVIIRTAWLQLVTISARAAVAQRSFQSPPWRVTNCALRSRSAAISAGVRDAPADIGQQARQCPSKRYQPVDLGLGERGIGHGPCAARSPAVHNAAARTTSLFTR